MRATWAKGAVLGMISMTAPVAFLPSSAADADNPVSISAGWWTEARTVTGDPIVPPDVPSDGLYAQNTIPGAGSEAAVWFVASTKVKSLTVHLEPSSVVSQPPLACVLLEPFVPTQAGSWDDRPDYDCTDPAAGTLSEDGTTLTFALKELKLKVGGVALVPATAVDRLVVAAPQAADVEVRAPHSGSNGPKDPGPKPPVEPTPDPAPGGGTAPVPTGVAPIPGPVAQAPATGNLPQAPPQTEPTPAPNTEETPAAAPVIDDVTWRRTLGVWLGLALALGCLVYWADGFGAIPLRRTRWLREARRTAVGRLGGAT